MPPILLLLTYLLLGLTKAESPTEYYVDSSSSENVTLDHHHHHHQHHPQPQMNHGHQMIPDTSVAEINTDSPITENYHKSMTGDHHHHEHKSITDSPPLQKDESTDESQVQGDMLMSGNRQQSDHDMHKDHKGMDNQPQVNHDHHTIQHTTVAEINTDSSITEVNHKPMSSDHHHHMHKPIADGPPMQKDESIDDSQMQRDMSITRIRQQSDHDMHKDHKEDMDDHDMEHMDHNKTSHMDMMMMYFHFGVKETILFKEWKTSTDWGMIASMIGIFIMGMLYEGLKYLREFLFKRYVSSIQFSTVAITGESGRVTQVHKVETHRMLSMAHATQTALHVVQIVVSYFLMLIFMTYNVWLCLSVILGAGVGYFVFGWKKASVVDITEHCH